MDRTVYQATITNQLVAITINEVNHHGQCECGSVRYTIQGTLRDVVNCHCKQCQRTHGNFAAYTATNKNNFRITQNIGLKWYQSSKHVQRGFCQQCGASLLWQSDDCDYICIAAGSIDPPTGLTTIKHIYVADSGDYYQLNDNLEKFPQRYDSH